MQQEIAPFLRGFTLPASSCFRSRFPLAATERFPCDTVSAAEVPAGVRLELVGDAAEVTVSFRAQSPHPLATPAESADFSFWVGNNYHGSASVAPNTTGTIRMSLPERDHDDVVRIYLPERYAPELVFLEFHGGTSSPAPDLPRWLAYGDSITQGWTSTSPGLAWPAVTARAIGLDVCNLGFAGAARGELPVAHHLAETPADVVSLAWGTNCWSQIPMDRPYITELVRLFLSALRSGHPYTPVVFLSPIVRPDAESTPNAVGATLTDLRGGIEEAVLSYAAAQGDQHLHLLRGGGLVAPEQLVDGIHPDDDGHATIAAAMTKALSAARETP